MRYITRIVSLAIICACQNITQN